MTNQWRKNEEMAVWGYDKKTKEFRQKKEAIKAPLAGFKLVTRVIVWSVFIGFYFFIFVLLLSGCAYLKGGGQVGYESKTIEKRGSNDDIIVNDLLPLEESSGEVGEPVRAPSEIVACIKMLPECNV